MNNHLSTLVRTAMLQLREAGVESAALDARLLMQEVLGCDHAAIIRDGDRKLGEREMNQFHQLLARRQAREPLSHIVGRRAFWRDEFFVCADVLDPRPDSETLIEAMLEARPNRDVPYRILDLGTGSGCLLLTLLGEYPHAQGVGVDISEAAARVAKKNAKLVGRDSRATFIVSQWTDALQTGFDMIISNPPYIARNEIAFLEPEVKSFEPYGALSGGDDGLDAYRELMPRFAKHLKPTGVAVLELGAGQAAAVSQLAHDAGLQVQQVRSDLAAMPRALVMSIGQ